MMMMMLMMMMMMMMKVPPQVGSFLTQDKIHTCVQVHIGLEELESSINEAALDTIFVHCENNPESTPLLPEQQQELRNRVCSRVRPVHEDAGFPGQKPGLERDSEPDPEQEGSHIQSPGAQKPGESFCKEVLSLFQEMLSQLQKTWQDVMACVQMCASLVNMVKSILSEIMNFCSSVAQSFSSLLQVQGVA
ncbi:interleukin-32-like isoform X2 [Myotis yumanensis]|uniref:interleukin-32-like isoform X2 n=1 Tax=Myotis yumanensis TaxID=159337 RepID=UPI0038CF3C1A